MTANPLPAAGPPASQGRAADAPRAWRWLLAAWLAALAATLGALFIGEVMGQAPCNLCWFQRIFMFPLAVILGLAAFRGDFGIARYALPLAALGWLIALYHSLLYLGIVPAEVQPCGAGPSCSGEGMTIAGVIPLPLVSLAAFTTIAGLLSLSNRSTDP